LCHAQSTAATPTHSLHDALPICKEHQCATIQLDFVQPENFKLEYQTGEPGIKSADGSETINHYARPVMIHRAIYGSLERFIAILDRKSTRLNSSHVKISYAVFCS